MDERVKREPVKVEGQLDKETLQAFARVAKSEDGIKLLRHLMSECGFKSPSMVMNAQTKEILTDATLWNEAKRGVWLDLRKLIPKKQLNIIEMER